MAKDTMTGNNRYKVSPKTAAKFAIRICCLITTAMMLIAAAVQRDGRLWGYDIRRVNSEIINDTLYTDGLNTVISTAPLAGDVIGYHGNTPLRIYLSGHTVDSITIEANDETPEFLEMVMTRTNDNLRGRTVNDIIVTGVDGVSGATYSSKAVNENIRRGLEFADTRVFNGIVSETSHNAVTEYEPKHIAAIIVLLIACIVPFFHTSKYYRYIQLSLNVIVLGCWSKSFISYSLLMMVASNGFTLTLSVITVLMLIAAFLMPLFGRRQHYCYWICPLGSAQELISRILPIKIRIPQKVVKILEYLRPILWASLMLLMWCGIGFEWLDYELFSFFTFEAASTVVIVATIVTGIISAIVTRPYCRFICPTGMLLKINEQ